MISGYGFLAQRRNYIKLRFLSEQIIKIEKKSLTKEVFPNCELGR